MFWRGKMDTEKLRNYLLHHCTGYEDGDRSLHIESEGNVLIIRLHIECPWKDGDEDEQEDWKSDVRQDLENFGLLFSAYNMFFFGHYILAVCVLYDNS
jgi:hypothetical protein